jgi:hypothetical protein
MARLTSLLLLLGLLGCSRARYETVTYPPRVDLTKHETIGVLQFSSPDQRELASMVTARFMEAARTDQGLVRMITLSSEATRPDAARIRELAKQYGLKTIVIGDLRLSKVRPSVSVSESLSSASVTGAIDATLAVEMIETDTGASLWSASGRARATLGGVHVDGLKNVGFGGVGKDSVYAGMVDNLVSQVTRDMHSSWERRRVE